MSWRAIQTLHGIELMRRREVRVAQRHRDGHVSHQLLEYTVLFEPAEEGGYVVTVPALPGCVTEGDTFEEAQAMAREAIQGFLEALQKAGAVIPSRS